MDFLSSNLCKWSTVALVVEVAEQLLVFLALPVAAVILPEAADAVVDHEGARLIRLHRELLLAVGRAIRVVHRELESIEKLRRKYAGSFEFAPWRELGQPRVMDGSCESRGGTRKEGEGHCSLALSQ